MMYIGSVYFDYDIRQYLIGYLDFYKGLYGNMI